MSPRITFIGAGAWGTALAMAAARNAPQAEVCLHARDAAQAQAMNSASENARYLPGLAWPSNLQAISGDLAERVRHSRAEDVWVVSTPMSGLRETLKILQGTPAKVAWLCKGFEAGTGLMPHEVQAQIAPELLAGALSGPSFAQEVAKDQPTALVAASSHAQVRQALVQVFHGHHLRVYANDDIVGVEVGGAVKNVLAIATGLCDGLGLGLNARAALITRGLAEMTRLGVALGARTETFMGLSGLGDLVLTATGELSRNRKVGGLLAQGLSLQQAVASLGHVAEGVYSARTVVTRAQALGVSMPIAEGVAALLDGHITPAQAVTELMRREAKGE